MPLNRGSEVSRWNRIVREESDHTWMLTRVVQHLLQQFSYGHLPRPTSVDLPILHGRTLYRKLGKLSARYAFMPDSWLPGTHPCRRAVVIFVLLLPFSRVPSAYTTHSSLSRMDWNKSFSAEFATSHSHRRWKRMKLDVANIRSCIACHGHHTEDRWFKNKILFLCWLIRPLLGVGR